MPVTVTDNNKSFEPNVKPSIEENTKVDTTSGKLIMIALAIAILAAVAFVMTSSNKPEIKTVEQPEQIISKVE